MTNLLLSQLLNGVQYGILLFLLAAGLTLAWRGASLFAVSAGCCGVVFVAELFLCR